MNTASQSRMVFLALAISAGPFALLHAQSIFGSNLIVNGGAEAGSAGTGLTPIVTSIPGWTRTGSATVLPYDLKGEVLLSDPAPPDHGFQYFADSNNGVTTLTQDIDVSSAASAIGAGTVRFTASAFLGVNGTVVTVSKAQFAVAFKNASGQTFSSITLDISGNSSYRGLTRQQQIGLVPTGTMRITATLTLNNIYEAADSLFLQLDTLGTSAASVLGPNLIMNPGAEDGPNAPPDSITHYIPGWSTAHGVTVAPYGGTGWISASAPGPSDRGINVFDGGSNASTMYQDLDVSPAAATIDSGKVTYAVSAWLGGLSGTSPVLTYDFFDWSGRQLAPTAQLGPASHTGISLVLVSHSDVLPAGTRRVHIALTFASYVYLADNISFSLSPAGGPVIMPAGVVPVFSTATTIQPGSWASIYGTNLAGTTTSWNGDFPTSLGNTSVTVNSKPAYLWFVSPTQINFQAPDDTATGSVNVVVTTPSGSATSTIALGPYGPSFSLYNTKYAAAIVLTPGKLGNSGLGFDYIGPTGGLPFTSRPAKAGETLLLFGVGFGPTNPAVPAGAVYSGGAPCINTPQLTIGSVPATVSFAGIVEAGLYQFNIVVPNAGSGDRLLQAIAGGITTPANVYVALQ